MTSGSTGRSLFQRTLAGGAAASGAPLGGLRVGARLDAVTLQLDHPSLCARSNDGWLDGWIFSASRSAIEDVIVGGAVHVVDGRHVAREAITRAYADTLGKLI